MTYYLHHLDPFSGQKMSKADDSAAAPNAGGISFGDATVSTASIGDSQPEPLAKSTLLLGGYSYGAMITAQSRPLGEVLASFASPPLDSVAAHIRLRAQHLAEQQNEILHSVRASALLRSKHPLSPTRHSGTVRVGGDEGSGSPRPSHESSGRHSFQHDIEDKLRRGVHDLMAKHKSTNGSPQHRRHFSHSHRSRHKSPAGGSRLSQASAPDNATEERPSPASPEKLMAEEAEVVLPAVVRLVVPRPAYLLVSPIQGLASHLATMSLMPSRMKTAHPADRVAEGKLCTCPCLAVYGEKDIFVSSSALRSWTSKLTSKEGSLFTSREVLSAGHFWSEDGVLYTMLGFIQDFAIKLISDAQ